MKTLLFYVIFVESIKTAFWENGRKKKQVNAEEFEVEENEEMFRERNAMRCALILKLKL